MATTTTPRSASALVLLAGDALDAAGLDADALAFALDVADNSDTRDTYGANYHDAIRGAARGITAAADRISGTTVNRDGSVTVTVGGGNDTSRALYRLTDDLIFFILAR